MSIDAENFNYVYDNYNKIIDDIVVIPRDKRNLSQEKLLSDALLMEKLIYDCQYGG